MYHDWDTFDFIQVEKKIATGGNAEKWIWLSREETDTHLISMPMVVKAKKGAFLKYPH